MRKKKVKWRWDMGCYLPFCPYCGELAYEKDHCAFCEKEYKWVGKSKERIVTVGEYTVCQASNNHITIVKDGIMVLHASCTKRKSKRQLKKMVDLYKLITPDEVLSEAKVLPYEFKGKHKMGEVEPHIEILKREADDEQREAE
jgi:hypothetical protein